ncbi:hypothetical protein A2U01_0035795, partial [Trifolium medium]|nr:hypothetical protein [Trifolium medium]
TRILSTYKQYFVSFPHPPPKNPNAPLSNVAFVCGGPSGLHGGGTTVLPLPGFTTAHGLFSGKGRFSVAFCSFGSGLSFLFRSI